MIRGLRKLARLGTRAAKERQTKSTMKTALTSLSLLVATGFPAAVLAEIAGISLPESLDVGAFGLFVAVLSLLILANDYAPRPTRTLTATTVPVSPHATEARRLAA
jgi:hypothetical protein